MAEGLRLGKWGMKRYDKVWLTKLNTCLTAQAITWSNVDILHGSHTFSETKFKDFLRTFHGQSYIFQALWNRYLAYCRCVILWWNNLPYIELKYSVYISIIYTATKNFIQNTANLRDLIAATGLVILLKLDLNRRFFSPCDLDTWWMTPKNNGTPLLCYFKLFASFRSHWWIQTGVTVRKRLIWVKIDTFFSRVTLKFDGWP